ncbi:helix-turn-helix domain-containing protein [Gloeobacter violaceus]|uniref:Glr3266 protein n=1 Tax=Gloeobacter violaceus (strain ATCC 29082 / PCC 7421) TaxID=251221 RepID=Q7NGA6_GLOVI|nr:helix-turn-helix domain-containing protein [Gloeobacter violaceus]BAC91207.1 glr3266 [Gloeobacter violaceus PCC 7421]
MPHRIALTPEQEQALLELKNDLSVPRRVRERAEALRLSAHGMNVPRIARYLDWAPSTVHATFERWWNGGIDQLFEADGRGSKNTWSEADLQYLEECLQREPRSYTSSQLAAKLAEERGVQLSADHLRKLLKKRASPGNESVAAL